MRASSSPESRLSVTPTHRYDNLCCDSTTKVMVNPNAPVSELIAAYCSKETVLDVEIVEAAINDSTRRVDEIMFRCGYFKKATINLIGIRLYALGDWQLQMDSSDDEISNALESPLKPEVWLPTGREPIKIFVEPSPAQRLV